MKKRIILVLILFFIVGCIKRDNDNTFLVPAIKKNYLFQKGSFWIYRDSISGRVDSFYLDSIRHIIPPATSYRRTDQEFFQLFIIQSSKYYPNDKIIWNMEFYAPSLLRGSYERKTEIYNFKIINLYVRDFIKPEAKAEYYPPEDLAIITKIPQYDMNMHSFKDVLVFSENKKADKNFGSTYYINDSVGYIKMRLNYNNDSLNIKEVWELQSWQIVK